MSTFPPAAYVEFQNKLADFQKSIQGLVEDLETWAGNKLDSNPNFNFSTASTDLETARTDFESDVSAITAL